jgi:NADH:ubiquinone oxidoreductase subunit 4 (subunit M)
LEQLYDNHVAVLVGAVVGVLLVGLYPQPLFDGVENATSALFQATQAAAAVGVGCRWP